MEPPQTQSGESLENGNLNGSFLVLNLGTNTVGFGNSGTFPVSYEASSPIATESPGNLKAVGDLDVASTSIGQDSTPPESKVVDEEVEDPDWVPEKKVRKCSSSACRKAKPKQGQFIDKNPSVVSSGGRDGMLISRPGAPPPYFVSLLNMFGWRVVFRRGFGDYVYISPTGLAFCSIPKAFETFLQDTSKYKELQNGAAVDGSGKTKRGTKKMNPTAAENTEPIVPIEEPLKQNPGRGKDKKSLQIQGVMVSRGANQVGSVSTVDEKAKSCVEGGCFGNEFMQLTSSNSSAIGNNQDSSNSRSHDRKVLGVRRSMRVNRTCVPVESGIDKARADDDCLYSSTSGVIDKARKGKKEQMTPISQAENLLDEKSKACMIDACLNSEIRKSECNNMTVMKRDQSRSSCMYQDGKLSGVRRSRRINTENLPVDAKVDAKMGAENSFLELSKSLVSTAAEKDKGKPLIIENVSDEKTDSRRKGECISDKTKPLDCSSRALEKKSKKNGNSMQRYGDVHGFRRSMRINGKHVPVDVELDAETGVDDFLDLFKFAANGVAKEDKEKLTTSEVEDMEVGSTTPDDAQPMQTTPEKSDYQVPKTHNLVENNKFKKSETAKNRSSEKCSLPLMGLGVEGLVAEKSCQLSAAKRKSVGGGYSNGKKKKKRKGGCGLMVRRNTKGDHYEETLSQTKVSILSWLIDSGILTERAMVVYLTKDIRGSISRGFITRAGIWCQCCKEVVSLLEFEAHAGSSLRQPWNNTFLISGKSLMKCLREAWEKEKKQKKVGFQTVGIDDPDPSDDTCGVCADGGHLICCDSCPSTFHQECVMLKALPEGSWSCPYCRCTLCMVVEHGSDRANGTSSMLSCKQCGCKYHQQCAWKNNMQKMGSVPFLFCGKNCRKVAVQVSDMLGIANPVEGGFTCTLLKRLDEDEGVSCDSRLSFIMECNVKLSMALSVLNECFVPLMDPRTGVDMLSQAVYNCGSNFKRLNYEGFYTVILEKDEEIIAVATLRLHGTNLAEMPFIGTRPIYQRQGMCRRLLKAIEDMLSSLHIKKLIIPAIPELLETWMTSFSFKPLELSHKDEIRNLSMMIFAETSLLQKSICNIESKDEEDDVWADSSNSNGKEIEKIHELPSSFGRHISNGSYIADDQDWWNPEYSMKDQKGAAPGLCRMIEDSTFAPDASTNLHSRNSNLYVSETSPIQRTPVLNLGMLTQSLAMAPLSFQPVNVVQDNDPVSAENTPPNRHITRWLRSADSLLSIRS